MKPVSRKWSLAYLMMMALVVLVGCGSGSGYTSDLSSSDNETSDTEANGGTGITNTFTSPSQLGVGDIMAIEFNSDDDAAVDFSSVDSGAGFIVVIGSYNSSGSGSSLQLTTNIASGSRGITIGADESLSLNDSIDADDGGFGPQEVMSAWLRASEGVLQDSESSVEAISNNGAMKSMSLKASSVGETETFRVLASLSSTNSYEEVTGEIKCVGSNVVFFLDTAVDGSLLSDEEISALCNEFDTIAGNEQALLGSISDVDEDGKLHVLMTKQINELGAMGGGIITGYFYAGDLYSRSSSNTVSNEREIIYTMVPDPDGIYGTAISKEFAMSNLLPAVLPHELQHAISYNQHVLVNEGLPEENWLNEGMSHFAEDLMGYGVENPSRYAMYLASPSSYGIVTQGSPSLIERGGEYLFLRFLYEQASDGAAFLRGLENTTERGVDNLEAAFNGTDMSSFSEFMARWTAALAMTDRGISQDRRYTYRPRVQNSETGNWEGVCLSCEADDNRDTVLEGVHLNQYYGYHTVSVDSSTAAFYEMTTLPQTMKISGSTGGGNFGLLIRHQ